MLRPPVWLQHALSTQAPLVRTCRPGHLPTGHSSGSRGPSSVLFLPPSRSSCLISPARAVMAGETLSKPESPSPPPTAYYQLNFDTVLNLLDPAWMRAEIYGGAKKTSVINKYFNTLIKKNQNPCKTFTMDKISKF